MEKDYRRLRRRTEWDDQADKGDMDLALVSGCCNLKAAENASKVQTAVAKKILDTQRADGAAAIKLLDAATSGPAKAGDALVAAATGLGGSIDAYG